MTFFLSPGATSKAGPRRRRLLVASVAPLTLAQDDEVKSWGRQDDLLVVGKEVGGKGQEIVEPLAGRKGGVRNKELLEGELGVLVRGGRGCARGARSVARGLRRSASGGRA